LSLVRHANSLAEFAVDGKAIPDVDFDVGESYSGLLPISDDPNDENNLFFWFFPSTNPAAEKEILIWLNGGVSSSAPDTPSTAN
jgi:carboxypeptidase D